MYSAMPWRLSGCAYMTCAVRYTTWLHPRLQLCDMPMAFSPFLQFPPLGSGKPGIAPACRNTYGSAHLQVVPLSTAMPSASMLAMAMPGVAASCNAVESTCPSEPCPAHRE
jgi:hypothetical protein